MRVICNVPERKCAARSIIDFEATNPQRGTAKHGSARIDLGISFAGPQPRILYEGGSLNSRRARSLPETGYLPGTNVTAPDDVRALALMLPEVIEGAHMGHPDFRVGGRIFATLWTDRMVVKLTRETQALMIEAEPTTFEAIPGSWGQRGWTNVDLAEADVETLRSALPPGRRSRPLTWSLATHPVYQQGAARPHPSTGMCYCSGGTGFIRAIMHIERKRHPDLTFSASA